MQLDKLDQLIVAVLQEDARILNRTLASRVHSSEATVRRRISRLSKSHLMRIVAVVDPLKQGYPVVGVFNMKIDQGRMREVKNALKEMKTLRFLGITIGAYDMVAEGWFQSTEEMFAFTTETLARIPGILRVEPLQILEMVTYVYDWGKSR
jgi:DNA-binding Lrp family transcriptional regulator